jgi:predicted lipoprotein with Yx(FWY)xxD motif
MHMNALHVNTLPLAVRIAAPLAASALLAAGCSSSSTASPPAAGGASSSAASTGGSATGAAKVETHSGPDGTYLTDASGRTLYLFMADSGGTSNCNGTCAAVWPPLTTTGAPTAGSGASAADLGTITRSDGTKQVTYSGHPLYYFAQDASAGQLTGQGNPGFGAKWWIVSPTGAAITTTAGG